MGILNELLEEKKRNIVIGTDHNNDLFWKLSLTREQKGKAKIRFLPHPNKNMVPFIKMKFHELCNRNTGKVSRWFSLSNINELDPAEDIYRKLLSENRYKEAGNFRTVESYISNIVVLEDPRNIKNENRIFFYRYSIKIHKMLVNYIIENKLDNFPGCDMMLISTGRKDGANRYKESYFPEKQSDITIRKDRLHNLDDLLDEDNFLDKYEIIDRIRSVFPEISQELKI